MNLDPVSIACAIAADRIREVCNGIPVDETGIVIATRYGNAEIRDEYLALLRRQRPSPARFAAAGFNACTAAAAVAAGVKGASFVLGGSQATFERAQEVGLARLRSGTVQLIFVGQCDWAPSTGEAACVMALHSSPEDSLQPHVSTVKPDQDLSEFAHIFATRFPILKTAAEPYLGPL